MIARVKNRYLRRVLLIGYCIAVVFLMPVFVLAEYGPEYLRECWAAAVQCWNRP